MTPHELKQQLREQRDGMEQNHAMRLHRALSWMLCADNYSNDDDLAFVTLWISFNACYSAEEQDGSLSDRSSFRQFLERICAQDTDKRIYHLLWMNYSNFVRSVVNNQFLFGPYWECHRRAENYWRQTFEKNKRAAMQALANERVSELLSIVLDRLYVLRNQIIHGGATYQSKVNREQVKSSRRLLAQLMPVVIEVMLNDQNTNWGDIRFPVIKA
ncbi:hypothetical protein [Glaciecola sp. SC05]|uniref:hypothetical protein n=1 Tax=Glaciecola sp. SC05 TaxID=1987355 RepID=UPI0035277E2F